jgi:hypothetical protein
MVNYIKLLENIYYLLFIYIINYKYKSLGILDVGYVNYIHKNYFYTILLNIVSHFNKFSLLL